MRGSNPAIAVPSAAPLTASRGERVAFLVLGLAILGAVIPVGQARPAADQAAVAAPCTLASKADCRSVAGQADPSAPAAAPRIVAMLMP